MSDESAKNEFLAYVRGLPEQDKQTLSYGLKMYSPKEMAREVEDNTEFGRHMVDLFKKTKI